MEECNAQAQSTFRAGFTDRRQAGPRRRIAAEKAAERAQLTSKKELQEAPLDKVAVGE
jgi:mannose-6-phosphate isomerase class I